MYAVQCCECHKWRTIPTKDEFETVRANFTDDPWFCSKRSDCSCEDPADIEYDSSRIWVIDKPNIPKPPPKTERLVIMRGDFTKMDTYYVLPNGKRARTIGDVQRFLDTNPVYKDSLSAESFSFTIPNIVEETVSHSSAWKTKSLKGRTRQLLQAARINVIANKKLFMCLLG